jgi:hypothetical protein
MFKLPPPLKSGGLLCFTYPTVKALLTPPLGKPQHFQYRMACVHVGFSFLFRPEDHP